MSHFPEPEQDFGAHAFAETANRHSEDRLIRAAGFQIHTRPRVGEPTWSLHGDVFSERQALEIAKSVAANRKAARK